MIPFSQYESQNPILKPVSVASRSEGQEAMAKLFGEVANVSFQRAVSLKEEESNVGLMNASNQAKNEYAKSLEEMAKNPAQSDHIAKNLELSLANAGNSPMNKQDRLRFESLSDSLKNDVNLKNAKYQSNIANLNLNMDFYDGVGSQLKLLQQFSAEGNEEQIENISNTIHETSRNAVLNGIISPEAYRNVIASVDNTINKASEWHRRIGSDDNSAAKIQALNWSPLGNAKDPGDLPSNVVTQIISGHIFDARVKQNLDDALIQGSITSPKMTQEFFNMSPEASEHYLQKMEGIAIANGKIASNHDFHDIDVRMNELENKKNLTTTEEYELKSYQNFFQNLYLGVSFWPMMSQTAEGSIATQEYQQQMAALQDHPNDPVVRQVAGDALNRYIHKGVSIAEGSNMSPQFIKPIPESMMTSVSAGFTLDADPSSVTSVLSQLDGNNRPYVANQLKNPTQQEVVRTISYGMDKGLSPNTINDLIVYNQDNRSFKSGVRNDEEPPIHRSVIDAKVRDSMPELYTYLKQFPPEFSDTRIKAKTNMLTNVVYGRLMRTSDFSDSNVDDVIQNLTNEMKKSYDFSASHNRIINKSQIKITDPQADQLADYLINGKAKEVLSDFLKDHNEVDAYLWKQNLTVVNNPEGSLLVVDNFGRTIYKTQFSEHLLSDAHHWSKEQKADQEIMSTVGKVYSIYKTVTKSVL